jgi:hypothetical protein
VKREDVHDAWAPDDGAWSDWVKPVLFASMHEEYPEAEPAKIGSEWARLAALVAARGPEPFAVVVDLPREHGVRLGLALAGVGYRPVPLYNAVPHMGGLVSLFAIMRALVVGASLLGDLSPEAPPAFLLDSLRLRGDRPLPGFALYDNRWVVRATDFPSPQKLEQAGVRRALLIRSSFERPSADLEAVLLGWQKRGIELWRMATTDDLPPPAPYVLSPRPWYARALTWLVSAEPWRRGDGAYGRFMTQSG